MPKVLGTPKVQYFKTGTVEYAAGYKVYTSVGGTAFADSPKSTYPTLADATAGTNANTNPVVLDARGEANIVINGDTRIVLTDATGGVIWTFDHYDSSGSNVYDSSGNELVTYTEVSSAANYINILNAATGNSPTISAQGDDVDVGLKVKSKAAGTLYLDGGSTGTVEINSTASGVTNVNTQLNAKAGLAVTGAASVSSTLSVTGAVTFGTSVAFNIIPAGIVMPYAGSSTPTGWLACDGSAVSRTTYATLFANISTTWGTGDGSTTFNLPDFRRKTLVGVGGSGTATLANTVGSTGGAETHTLQTTEIPSHTHTYTLPTTIGVTTGGTNLFAQTPGTQTSGSTGGGGSHNNMQPSAVVNYIIKAY